MPTIDLPAGRLHYVERGGGPPVVLLHGVLMDHTVWDDVLDRLPDGFRYVLPDLPLGAHPEPLRPGTDLSLAGLNRLVADFLEALDLTDVTLVHNDWGGALFLTAYGLDQRVSRLIITTCEAYDNFPPGIAGKMAVLVARLPGRMMSLGARQLRVGRLRRLPILFGWMSRVPVPDPLMYGWTEPGLRDRRILDDLRRYALSDPDPAELIEHTEALLGFAGDALVIWSTHGKLMPREHGRRLAELIPRARLVELEDSYVLPMLDAPDRLAEEMSAFLVATRAGE